MEEQQLARQIINCERVLREIPQPMLLLDGGLRVLLVNRHFLDAFGCSENQVRGRFPWDLDGPPWKDRGLRQLLMDVVERRKTAGELEVDDTFAQLGRRVLRISIQDLPPDRPDERVLLLSVQDATATVVANRRAQSAIQKLEASNVLLTEFASFAAHELQAPVNRIASFLDLVKLELRGGSKERVHHYLATVQKQTKDMMLLIRNLLALGKIKAPSETEDVRLAELIPDVMDVLDEQIRVSGALIEFGPLPVVRGCKSRLTELFINLLDNAIRYRKMDLLPHIRIESNSVPDGIEVLIRDNGMGFDEELAAEIFKPFRRLAKSPQGGTGLGLTICARIMESLGGTIRATSQPLVGTTFILLFPKSALPEYPSPRYG